MEIDAGINAGRRKIKKKRKNTRMRSKEEI
jgi:hypothetical protein